MNQKPLSWQEILLVLLSLVLFAGGIMTWAPNIDPPFRTIGQWIFTLTIVLMLILTIWDFRANYRKDVFPDILARLTPPQDILHLGHTHFSLSGAQQGDVLKISCLIQNLFDAPTETFIELTPKSGEERIAYELPPLDTLLAPGAVVRATMEIPLRAYDYPGAIKFAIAGTAKAQGGRKVRFGRRGAVTKPLHPLLRVLALLGGHITWGGGTFLHFSLNPVHPHIVEQTDYTPAIWTFETEWLPGKAEESKRGMVI